MPISPTYPGVYVQEAPSGARAIIGVSTSVAAFIGFFRQGPLDVAVQIFNLGDFERIYGGLDDMSEASYQIQQFFSNDGEIAWVVRTASEDATDPLAAASVDALTGPAGAQVLGIAASNPGAWGNQVSVGVDYNTSDPRTLFNLTAVEFQQKGDELVAGNTLVFRNLSMDPTSAVFAPSVVNAATGTILTLTSGDEKVTAKDGTITYLRPPPSGTSSGDLSGVDWTKFKGGKMDVSINGGKALPLTIGEATQYSIADELEGALRGLDELSTAGVDVGMVAVGDTYAMLVVRLLSPAEKDTVLVFSGPVATTLLLTGTDGVANVQAYSLGVGATAGGQANAKPGGDGKLPTAKELIGSELTRTGIYALEAVDVFNLLIIARIRDLTAGMGLVVTAGTNYCEARRAFMIVDMSSTVDSVQKAREWMDKNASLQSKNGAVYFPSLEIPDPLNDYRQRAIGPSGTMAGLYARTDSDRGVWKAPAGIEATVKGVQGLSYMMTDDENGVINPVGVNAIRSFPGYATVSWGARTLKGSDALASEWKYIPVRRLALYIEESLFRGLKWAVFEPNGELLWQQIRLTVGSFMHGLFRQGAFKGTSPKESYFVTCDASTTSQNDIDKGIVNVVVGFAPLKPAEFVIVTIEQMAGQIDT